MRTLAIVLLLSACATSGGSSTYVYRKPGSSQATYDADIYACERDAAPVQDLIQKRSMVNRCMAVHGWSVSLE